MKAIALTIAWSMMAASALLLTECSSSSNGGTGNPDGGVCPADPPTVGAACALPNGTECNGYAQSQSLETCGGPYLCENGTWEGVGTSAGGAIACPITSPVDGSTCSVPTSCGGGAPLAPTCTYGCDQGGPTKASCTGGTWVVTPEESFAPCLVDAGIDASTNDASSNDASTDGGDAG